MEPVLLPYEDVTRILDALARAEDMLLLHDNSYHALTPPDLYRLLRQARADVVAALAGRVT